MVTRFNILGLIFFVVSLYLQMFAQAELYSAITDMESLKLTHKMLINKLDRFIYRETKRLDVLKRRLNYYSTEHRKANKDIPNYIGNPINAFTLIKRLTIDLVHVKKKSVEKTQYRRNNTVLYPTKDDMIGATLALTRLRTTYRLNITELANGKLRGNFSYGNKVFTENVTPMSASDCYELGRVLYELKDFKEGIPWMKAAHTKYQTEKHEAYPFTDYNILEHITYAYFALDDVKSTLEWNNRILSTLRPGDARITKHKVAGNYYEKLIAEEEEAEKIVTKEGIETDNELSVNENNITMYESLCRGELEISSKVLKRLKCRYHSKTNPFLRLAPIKMEQLYRRPNVFMFYEVISDEEIEHLKELATPKLNTSMVHDTKTYNFGPDQFRVSKMAWLPDSESQVVARISRRISDITGLSLDSAANLQVANYATGGFFGPHYDFFRTNNDTSVNIAVRNRIATMLFYLSDVKQGGATVFTELGLTVFPVKRAAIFWMNLHPSLQGDLAMRHAGCPVLHGTKWVANKWLHHNGQEFLRPCNLKYEEEGILYKIPKPELKSL